ncbi:hypothetical protein EW146_g9811 [Bondarzewia mesenterica]|uniref:Reverse transcriptase Ty1/copia-type domain-containing protein n=1 Tax=Bondarzewia mesenterica TaxID=1095465 RepID=A0A4S4L319_9AGAM|nr:hypothetical protein EW146_g9811 [Bondarzewia mesenterica]
MSHLLLFLPPPPSLTPSPDIRPVSAREIPSIVSSSPPLAPSVPPSPPLPIHRSTRLNASHDQAVTNSHLACDHICALGRQPSDLPPSKIDAPPPPSDLDDPNVPMMLAVVEEIRDEPRTWAKAQAFPHATEWFCLVAKGFTQVQGLDFNETYSPVTHLESQRITLHLAASLDWDMEQLDVKTAFLYGELEEDIWMEQPTGFAAPGQED